jgi:hypothetical protein
VTAELDGFSYGGERVYVHSPATGNVVLEVSGRQAESAAGPGAS